MRLITAADLMNPEVLTVPQNMTVRELARYLTDKRNPLVWRSAANRTWLYHMGRGIVDSPNDFGRMGMRPSHPELLDWLAARLRETGSVKDLHRQIVLSSRSRVRPEIRIVGAAYDRLGIPVHLRRPNLGTTTHAVRTGVRTSLGPGTVGWFSV